MFKVFYTRDVKRMKLRWLGCAGYEIVTEKKTVLYVDPWLTSNTFNAPITVSDIKRADAVLLTHAHFDHAADVPDIINRTKAILIASQEEMDGLNQIERMPKDQLQPVLWDSEVEVKGCKIYVTKAVHLNMAQLAVIYGTNQIQTSGGTRHIINVFRANIKAILSKGFLITTETGLRIWHLGSCVPIPELASYSDILRPQVAIVQVSRNLEKSVGFENVKMIRLKGVGPSIILPHHHMPSGGDVADVNLFTKLVKQTFPEMRVLNPNLGRYYQFKIQYLDL